VALLAAHGGAVLLAGGQSLLPLMKQGLAAPAALVDVSRVSTLRHLSMEGGTLRIGAAARQADLELSPVVSQAVPLLAHAASHVGDPQVRHRGTIGGTLGQGDGTADLPAALIALHAWVTILGPQGQREVMVDALWADGTQLAAVEVITEVSVPVPAPGTAWAFRSLRHRLLDPAVVAVAVQHGDRPGIGLAGMGPRPLRAGRAEQALLRRARAQEVASQAQPDADPPSDAAGSAAYRRHLCGVLLADALRDSAPGP
jgi:carbon-monoxide dehydrogenase medium subunit